MSEADIQRSVRRVLLRLRRELDGDLEEVANLAAVADRAEEVAELRVDLDRQAERVRSAAVITLVGATAGACASQSMAPRPSCSAPATRTCATCSRACRARRRGSRTTTRRRAAPGASRS